MAAPIWILASVCVALAGAESAAKPEAGGERTVDTRCAACTVAGAAYTDCGKCGPGDAECKEETALLVGEQTLAAFAAWSPSAGGSQPQTPNADYVPWAPAVGYGGGGQLYIAGGGYEPQSDKAYMVNMSSWEHYELPSLTRGIDWPGNGALGVVGPHLVACSGWTDDVRTCEHMSDGHTWESIPVPETMCGRRATVATHKCRVYVTGGTCEGQQNAVHSYDPYTKTWRQEPSMLHKRNEHGLASWGDRLVACGGWNADMDATAASGAKLETMGDAKKYIESSCEALEDGAGEWVEIAPMSKKRVQFALVPLNGQLAAIGDYSAAVGKSSYEVLRAGAWETAAGAAFDWPIGWFGAAAVPAEYLR